MNDFTELINLFDMGKASFNEKLLYNAVCALVTENERLQRELDDKATKEMFYG